MATFSDDFNRADATGNNALGANWTHELTTGWKLLSNEIVSQSTADQVLWYSATQCASNDNYAQCTLATITSAVGPVCRGNGSTSSVNGYFGRQSTGSYGLQKIVAGTRTSLGSDITVTNVTNAVSRVQADGSTITGSYNGAPITPFTDTSITAGTYCGIWCTNTAAEVDNFSGGDLGTGTTVNFPRVWNGSTWVSATGVKVWNGTTWVDVTGIKRWNGSAWVDSAP